MSAFNEDRREACEASGYLYLYVILVFISGDDLATYPYAFWLKQSTVTSPAVCHDKVVNQRFVACSGSPHDDESSH